MSTPDSSPNTSARGSAATSRPPRILILGGGYVGLYTALRLQSKLRAGEAVVTVVEPRSYMTYQPFLPEASAGSLSPRHVVVPLRRVLKKCEIINARVVGLDHERRTARLDPLDGPEYDYDYDAVVVALGSVARTLPIPGLADQGVGFKTIEEAIYLRNQVLNCLDVAESTDDRARRRRALTFCFVGGGYAGVEALAELEDLARDATKYYKKIHADDLRFLLVEAADRILPEVGPDMGEYTVMQLSERNIDIRLGSRLDSCVGGVVKLSDGTTFESDTIVWTAGVKANPALTSFRGLPLDEKGKLRCNATLQVTGVDAAWGAGDNAAVPDLTNPGTETGPSAQHAVRQARRLADNILATLRGGTVTGVPPRVRRLGRQPRPAQGRRARLRDQAQGLAGVVHASDLPPVTGADAQPQAARRDRLDAGPVLQARDRLARLDLHAVPRVRGRGRCDVVDRGAVDARGCPPLTTPHHRGESSAVAVGRDAGRPLSGSASRARPDRRAGWARAARPSPGRRRG